MSVGNLYIPVIPVLCLSTFCTKAVYFETKKVHAKLLTVTLAESYAKCTPSATVVLNGGPSVDIPHKRVLSRVEMLHAMVVHLF